MANSLVWKITFLLVIYFATQKVSSDSECDWSKGRKLNLSIKSRRNETGQWTTSFSVWRESNGTVADIDVEIMPRAVECQGKHIFNIEGVIRESTTQYPLVFHPKCGKNARILNDGRSVEKIDVNDGFNGVAITSRPLLSDELFEVQLDKKNNKFTDAIGIGITTHSPDEIDIPRHMNSMTSGTWMIYLENVYQNGTLIKRNYMKNLKEVKVGERVGVKRTKSGELHLFVRGVDQGIAAKDVPSQVYGVFELYQDATMGTIINSI